MGKRLFTSESVTEGHPDKMCDAISDAILDALMEKDPMSRVACETAVTTGVVMVMGEITTQEQNMVLMQIPAVLSLRLTSSPQILLWVLTKLWKQKKTKCLKKSWMLSEQETRV